MSHAPHSTYSSACDPARAEAASPAPGAPAPRRSFAPFRLRRHADYGRVYAASRKYSSASLSFFFRVREPGEQPAAGPRIGLTAGRVLGKAVVRNRIKRRMREAVRLHLQLLVAPGTPPVDLVLHPRRSVAEMDFALLDREVAALLERVARMAPHGPQPPDERDRRGRKGSPPTRKAAQP